MLERRNKLKVKFYSLQELLEKGCRFDRSGCLYGQPLPHIIQPKYFYLLCGYELDTEMYEECDEELSDIEYIKSNFPFLIKEREINITKNDVGRLVETRNGSVIMITGYKNGETRPVETSVGNCYANGIIDNMSSDLSDFDIIKFVGAE